MADENVGCAGLFVGLIALPIRIVVVLFWYGLAMLVFRYAFGIELPNPFDWLPPEAKTYSPYSIATAAKVDGRMLKVIVCSIALIVVIGGLALEVFTVAAGRDFAIWLYVNCGWLAAVPLFAGLFWLSIVMEKAEQRRLGVKRPLFRFTNDPPPDSRA
jgi:hypothetical protein